MNDLLCLIEKFVIRIRKIRFLTNGSTILFQKKNGLWIELTKSVFRKSRLSLSYFGGFISDKEIKRFLRNPYRQHENVMHLP